MRFAVSRMLTDSGCEVSEAVDAAAATSLLSGAAGVFDVVLLDYQMPDSTDLQILERVHTLSPASRVVMMTAYATPQMIADATRLGATSVLYKPIDFDELYRLVTSC
jgi:two-component system response regulator FlrC